MSEKLKVIAVVGPTASGKSGLAIEIAKRFDGEVISCDSRQVYRGLDIGTAKVTKEEMQGVPHHLIDVCDVDRVFSGADFVREAAAAIDEVNRRGRLAVIAGGTFFWLDLLRGKTTAAPVEPNHALRAELEPLTTPELYERLQTLDPARAAAIDRENPRRLLRAIEIASTLGTVPTATTSPSPFDLLIIGLETEKEELRARFRSRAADWLALGFRTEVEGLLARGVSRARLSEIGFEYTLMLELIDNKVTETEFVDKFEQKNWQYAKRQLTWLKRDSEIHWFERENTTGIFALVNNFLGL